MAEEPLGPVYLLGGSDRPKLARALHRLRARFPDGAAETLSADQASGADAAAACNALGLLGADGGRLVLVEGVERWRKDDVEALRLYLADPAPGAVLALVATEVPKSDALAELCAREGQVLLFDVPKPRDPTAWVEGELRRLGVTANPDAARALLDRVGPDVTLLAGEIDKLATWAGDEPIGRREVEALAVPGHEGTAWALTDAWGARDLASVLAVCESELELGVEPFLIAARLAAHIGLVRSVQLLAEEGLPTREIAKRLRKHEFRVRKAVSQGERYTREELDGAVVRLAELDAALKGASRLGAELELERALVALTREPSHAAERAPAPG